jgi:hypothetical protein
MLIGKIRNLQPGGWVEALGVDFPYVSDDGTLKPDSALVKWTETIVTGLKVIGCEAVAKNNIRRLSLRGDLRMSMKRRINGR